MGFQLAHVPAHRGARGAPSYSSGQRLGPEFCFIVLIIQPIVLPFKITGFYCFFHLDLAINLTASSTVMFAFYPLTSFGTMSLKF